MSQIVIAHDYLTQRGGAERVVLSLLRAFPTARLVTSVFEPGQTFPTFAEIPVETLFLNHFSAVRRDARKGLLLYARAWHAKTIRADLVICSSSGWAHGVQTSGYKIVYCHNTARWLYQPEDYLRQAGLAARVTSAAVRRTLRRWDAKQAETADLYLANSSVVADRVRTTYGFDAPVLHPPVSVTPDGAQEQVPGLTPGFILTVGRARGYKNTAEVCRAVAARPDWTLVVVGGKIDPNLPANVIGLDRVSDAQLRWLYANCSALVAVASEDFGLTVPEVASFGKPAVTWRSGGYLETVDPARSGVFVDQPTADQILRGLETLFGRTFHPDQIRQHAAQFRENAFIREIRRYASAGLAGRRLERLPELPPEQSLDARPSPAVVDAA